MSLGIVYNDGRIVGGVVLLLQNDPPRISLVFKKTHPLLLPLKGGAKTKSIVRHPVKVKHKAKML